MFCSWTRAEDNSVDDRKQGNSDEPGVCGNVHESKDFQNMMTMTKDGRREMCHEAEADADVDETGGGMGGRDQLIESYAGGGASTSTS